MMRAIAALVLACAAAGCAPTPPLLTLSGRTCDAAPALASATPVPFDSTTGATVTFGPDSPCMDMGGGRSVTYAVFSLPAAQAPYQLSISSDVVGHAVVAPVAQFFDASAAKGRRLDTSDFRQGITGFTAGLRAQPTDRLLLVYADPGSVGQPTLLRLGARAIGTQVAATVIVPVFLIQPLQDQLRERGATLSLNGKVRVAATPIPTVP